jgi:hypothetical protein
MTIALVVAISDVAAQAPPRPPAPKPDANMLQLMRGVLYPASNVLFAAQEDLRSSQRPLMRRFRRIR